MARRRSRVPGTPGKHRDWPVTLVQFGICEEEGCTADHGAADGSEGWGYTTTLWARHRVPDLRMAAVPDEGDAAPLNPLHLGFVLQRLAEGVVARKYYPGKAVGFPAGSLRILCRLGDPVPRDALEAFRAHPDAEVIPVTWTPLREHTHQKALTFGRRDGAKVESITYSEARIDETDSGFVLDYEGAPLWLSMDAVRDAMGVICINCLIDEQPEVGRGLDLARRFGSAELVDGVWVGVHPGWRELERSVAQARSTT